MRTEDTFYDLKPCPFCGSTLLMDYFDCRIECENCGAHGPQASSTENAVKWWNEVPRLSGGELNRQRWRWAARLRAMEKEEKRSKAERKKAEALEREYKKWAADREAWLRAPIGRREQA